MLQLFWCEERTICLGPLDDIAKHTLPGRMVRGRTSASSIVLAGCDETGANRRAGFAWSDEIDGFGGVA
jgi:hypothetical protein